MRGSLHCTDEKTKMEPFLSIRMYMDTLTTQLKNGLLPPTNLDMLINPKQ